MQNNIPDWDQYFMTMAYLAAMRSKDRRTKIGAVIVDRNRIPISTGYNGLARGLNDHRDERQEKPEKYHWFEHAERNAIYNAARTGISIAGCTLYTFGVPCMDCTRGVIQSGLARVVTHEEWMKQEPDQDRWERSRVMFLEAGVALVAYSGPLLHITPWLDGANPFAKIQQVA